MRQILDTVDEHLHTTLVRTNLYFHMSGMVSQWISYGLVVDLKRPYCIVSDNGIGRRWRFNVLQCVAWFNAKYYSMTYHNISNYKIRRPLVGHQAVRKCFVAL